MPISASDAPVWRGYTRAALEAQYNLAWHPERNPTYTEFAERSRAARALLRNHAVAYGEHPREHFEIFPGAPGAPVLVFFHGGYWRALDMAMWSFVAAPFVARGITVANVEYPLAPERGVPSIVESALRSIAAVRGEALRLGAADRLFVSGHSAGGHLAAMALATDWRTRGVDGFRPAGGIPVSGLFDLEPLRHVALNDTLGMTAVDAAYLSPCASTAPVLAAVGGDETIGFQRQTAEYVSGLKAAGAAASTFVVPNTNHFTVMSAFADPRSTLFQAMLALMTPRNAE